MSISQSHLLPPELHSGSQINWPETSPVWGISRLSGFESRGDPVVGASAFIGAGVGHEAVRQNRIALVF